MRTQAFCVHAHFYQPPREDPLSGEIPLERGASPYKNWNERINDHCYLPNAEAGNFGKISFNIGPTLAGWIAKYSPKTMKLIVAQERQNYEKYGVGNGMAQPYNHTILPLAPRYDKVTEVRWGIADFEMRFGHKPEGMWLPETAVDTETLEVMAECGIRYTILAPWQADADNVDVFRPYHVALSDGKDINVFFYNQQLSTGISFNPGVTVNADRFTREVLLPTFPLQVGSDETDLLMVASDGELYGHHQPFREKFLAYLMDGALKNTNIEVSYPGLWLKQHPPTESIRILDNTSWSCHHGIERWRGACDCTPNGEWKKPFREALRHIALLVDEQYELAVQSYLSDPWELRHRYIETLQGQISPRDLIRSLLSRRVTEEHIREIELLLNAQYERRRMFTSCGWFFDDYDRIEPQNNTAYAAQAVWLTYLATGIDLSEDAIEVFSEVKSWRSGLRASDVFKNHLQKARDSLKVRFWK
jgi:alpha-amylase/alpha-mannosidase (GH57 family)